MNTTKELRELTREERLEIRKLATGLCANYDTEYGCLSLDCPCYMLHKWYTGVYCKYFKSAVLPVAPTLAAALTDGDDKDIRPCAFCGAPFTGRGRKAYCSENCAAKAHRRQKRESIRKKRGWM